ncbi:hypothetical protein MSAN_01995900 [Mycena sanguinolenta]|uniref:Uncharacterized protein n=1 Tax=Mycena sanguinolenta TaxID=230812 RepID=A0A8H6XLU0_9AGAR|nr:hypothetical protein MSAN_01995900 [Mycena sanguinolenta]
MLSCGWASFGMDRRMSGAGKRTPGRRLAMFGPLSRAFRAPLAILDVSILPLNRPLCRAANAAVATRERSTHGDARLRPLRAAPTALILDPAPVFDVDSPHDSSTTPPVRCGSLRYALTVKRLISSGDLENVVSVRCGILYGHCAMRRARIRTAEARERGEMETAKNGLDFASTPTLYHRHRATQRRVRCHVISMVTLCPLHVVAGKGDIALRIAAFVTVVDCWTAPRLRLCLLRIQARGLRSPNADPFFRRSLGLGRGIIVQAAEVAGAYRELRRISQAGEHPGRTHGAPVLHCPSGSRRFAGAAGEDTIA